MYIDPTIATATAVQLDKAAQDAQKEFERVKSRRATKAEVEDAEQKAQESLKKAQSAAKLADLATMGTSALLATYTIRVITGDKPEAGTTATASIELIGLDANATTKANEKSTGKFVLNVDKRPFERAKAETFTVREPKFSEITKVKLSHDGHFPGASWYVEGVEIKAEDSGKIYYFACNNWLSDTEGDKKLERELPLDVKQTRALNAKTPYEIEVYTGKGKNSGTDSKAFISLFGSKGSVADVPLKPKGGSFEAGKVDKFVLDLSELGELNKVRVRQDNTGAHRKWFIDKVSSQCDCVMICLLMLFVC